MKIMHTLRRILLGFAMFAAACGSSGSDTPASIALEGPDTLPVGGRAQSTLATDRQVGVPGVRDRKPAAIFLFLKHDQNLSQVHDRFCIWRFKCVGPFRTHIGDPAVPGETCHAE